MDRDRNGHDGRNGQEWTAEWTMDNGQWTMDNGRWTEIMSRLSGLILNIADPSDPTDQSEKTIDQITNSRAIPSVKAATPIKIFVPFRVVRG